MCSKCEQIDSTMARYVWVKTQINDQQLHEAAERLLMELEAEKLTLHPEE